MNSAERQSKEYLPPTGAINAAKRLELIIEQIQYGLMSNELTQQIESSSGLRLQNPALEQLLSEVLETAVAAQNDLLESGTVTNLSTVQRRPSLNPRRSFSQWLDEQLVRMGERSEQQPRPSLKSFINLDGGRQRTAGFMVLATALPGLAAAVEPVSNQETGAVEQPAEIAPRGRHQRAVISIKDDADTEKRGRHEKSPQTAAVVIAGESAAENVQDFIPQPVPEPEAEPVKAAIKLGGEAPVETANTKPIEALNPAKRLIQRGDTLSEIAREAGSSVAQLAEMNGIANPDLIIAGETLLLPGEVHTIDRTPVAPETEPETLPQDVQPTAEPATNSLPDVNDEVEPTPDLPQADAATKQTETDDTPAVPLPEAEPAPSLTISELTLKFLSHPNIQIRDARDRDILETALNNNGETWIQKCSADPGVMHATLTPNIMELLLGAAEAGHEIYVYDNGEADAHSCTSHHGQGSGRIEAMDLAADDALYSYLSQHVQNGNQLGVNELIYHPPPEGHDNYKNGQPHDYSHTVKNQHTGHIHVSASEETTLQSPTEEVLAPPPAPEPAPPPAPPPPSEAPAETVENPQVDPPQLTMEAEEALPVEPPVLELPPAPKPSVHEHLRSLIGQIDNNNCGAIPPEKVQEIMSYVADEAQKRNLAVTPTGAAAITAMMCAESSLNHNAVGGLGEVGLFQAYKDRAVGIPDDARGQVGFYFDDIAKSSSGQAVLEAIVDPQATADQLATTLLKDIRPKNYKQGYDAHPKRYDWTKQIVSDMTS